MYFYFHSDVAPKKRRKKQQPSCGMSSATLLFTTGTLMVLMASWCVPLAWAKTYDRCQLASDLLYKYKLPANQISQCTDFFTLIDIMFVFSRQIYLHFPLKIPFWLSVLCVYEKKRLLSCATNERILYSTGFVVYCRLSWRRRRWLLLAGICLVRWESDFNTSAIGSLNTDGSLDHGLFQISDRYWCDRQDGMDGACGLSCAGDQVLLLFVWQSHRFKTISFYRLDLRNEDIKDDVICAKRIFRHHQHHYGSGFNAW